MIPTLLLAAGRSSRMGGTDKLLQAVNGAPLLQVMAERALTLGPTYVTVPSLMHRRRFVLPRAALVVAVTGEMSDSLRAGIAALPDAATGVLILPADLPDITAKDLAAIKAHAETSQARIVRATTFGGRPGHPTYFARGMFADLQDLTGDRGAAGLCAKHEDQTVFVPLAGERACLDLDTPEDWRNWRATRSSTPQ